MKKGLIILIFLFFSCFVGSAQKEANLGAVRGIVLDSGTNQALPYVNVIIENTKKGTTTDSKGIFKLSGLQKGFYFGRYN